MPLPLTVSCFSKIQIGFTFLVPVHLGSPGKRAVKWVCVFIILVEVCLVALFWMKTAFPDRLIDWLSCGFTSYSAQNRSFWRRFPKPISWLGMEKTKPNTTKARFQKTCTTTQINTKKLKPGLVTFYNIWPGNGVGLFSKEKISKRGDK